ncbi:diaminopimelate decarboxylase, partial [Leucobacter sp. M11]|nr:diaminopimelate decarboxylase [Leucobacter sp. M11]
MTDTAAAPADTPAELNELDPAVFSRTVRRGRDCGELKVGEKRASELIAEFGSPLYVIDEADAKSRAAEILAAFQREFARVGAEATVYYAGKAFLCIEVARWMTE